MSQKLFWPRSLGIFFDNKIYLQPDTSSERNIIQNNIHQWIECIVYEFTSNI